MNPQQTVQKVLDYYLLPKFPYNLIVVDVGGIWYVNVEFFFDGSELHEAEPAYWNRFYYNIRPIIDKALDLLGGIAFLNSINAKNITELK
jgi:hypothetical protein